AGGKAENVEGKDLSPLLAGKTTGGSGLVFSGATRTNPLMYSVRGGNYKLIMNGRLNRHALFDIAQDPGENNNIAPQMPQIVAQLRTYMDDVVEAARSKPLFEAYAPQMSTERRELLRSLGYEN